MRSTTATDLAQFKTPNKGSGENRIKRKWQKKGIP